MQCEVHLDLLPPDDQNEGDDKDDDGDKDANLAMMKSLSARLSGSENARGPR